MTVQQHHSNEQGQVEVDGMHIIPGPGTKSSSGNAPGKFYGRSNVMVMH